MHSSHQQTKVAIMENPLVQGKHGAMLAAGAQLHLRSVLPACALLSICRHHCLSTPCVLQSGSRRVVGMTGMALSARLGPFS